MQYAPGREYRLGPPCGLLAARHSHQDQAAVVWLTWGVHVSGAQAVDGGLLWTHQGPLLAPSTDEKGVCWLSDHSATQLAGVLPASECAQPQQGSHATKWPALG